MNLVKQNMRPSFEEWKAEGQRRFGKFARDWRFVCPHCKDEASGQDFLDLGLSTDEAAKHLGQQCIGRSLGAIDKAIPKGQYKGRGCDWLAYGLFRGPVLIHHADGGDLIGAFCFADPPELDRSKKCTHTTRDGRQCIQPAGHTALNVRHRYPKAND